MTGAADWQTIIAITLVAVVAWGLGFWFASYVGKLTAETKAQLREEIANLRAQIAALEVKAGTK